MRLLVALTEVFHSDGGIPMFNRTLLGALGRFCQVYGAQATVLVLNDAPADADPRYLSSSVRLRAYESHKWAFALGLWRELLAGADVLVLGHLHLLPLALPPALFGCPYCVVAHGIEAWRKLPGLSRSLLRRARTVLAVSDYTRRRLAAENGVASERWRLLPNTLDPFFSPAAVSPGSAPVLLSVCRLAAAERYKGIDDVLAVLPALRRQFPALRYVIVGEGDDRPRLEEKARELRIADIVTFTGYLSPSALTAHYASCSAFVLPSSGEGFGIVFLEAMAHSKPVVAAHHGGVPEVVLDGETGLLVPWGNREALLQALSRLLSDDAQRERLGAAGRQRLEENFSFERFCHRLTWFLVEEFPELSYLSRWSRLQKQGEDSESAANSAAPV
ncbi:MAG: glycosyltransferase family 4 protein [Acidobacteria bacterium]|nr:glycosyltransferase family 4 protein [Acidobacteriota bacterium]